MNALDTTTLDMPIDTPLMGEINMTPLVDVMLVLLIVFMVTLPALVDAAQVRLPQARSTPLPRNLTHVDVQLAAEGAPRWNGAAVTTEALHARLRQVAQQDPQPQIRLYADRATPYAYVADLLAMAQRAGVQGVAFVTTVPTGTGEAP
ncbi:MAG: ExbD/TolR family protein [Anaerolineae bacterium]